MSGWIGVDLDGTIAHYSGWQGIEHVGEPIKPMCDRVRLWLSQGKRVKVFTARVAGINVNIIGDRAAGVSEKDIKGPIEEFCIQEFGQILEITNIKDFGMIELWDDRAVQVEMNTGRQIQ